MEEAYPDIFVLNKNIALVLKCQQFVEMAAEIARQDSLANPVTGSSSNGQSLCSVVTPRSTHSHSTNPHKRTYGKYVDSQAEDIEAPPARRTPPFSDKNVNTQSDVPMEDEPCSSSAAHLSPRNGHAMEGVKNGSGPTDGVSLYHGAIHGSDGDTTIVEEENIEDDGDVEIEDGIIRAEETAAQAVEYQKYNEVIDFGRSIYALSLQIPNLSGSTKAILNDSLATICLLDYAQFESHHLLSEEHLSDLAKQTASAILEFGGRSAQSQLSRYFNLWSKLQLELASAKIPHCAFADVAQLVFGHTNLSSNNCTSSSAGAQDDSAMVVG